jgi:phage FluMu protein gp41
MLQTEFEFMLPTGYIDEQNQRHQRGIMRLATAKDEIEPLSDARVKQNELYLGVMLLSRVVTRIGEISPVTTAVIENLFSSDYAYLQELYLQINVQGSIVETRCPNCGHHFELDLNPDQNAESTLV